MQKQHHSSGETPLLQFFDPDEPISNMSGNLPYWRQDRTIYFVTFRLADSMPQEKSKLWMEERDAWHRAHPEPHDEKAKQEYSRIFPARFQKWLDAGYGECILARNEVRLLVENALRYFAADVVNGADVRMIESGGSPRLPFKALQRLAFMSQLLGQELQSHTTSQAGVFRFMNDIHSPAAEFLDDLVVRYGLADFGHRHLRRGLQIDYNGAIPGLIANSPPVHVGAQAVRQDSFPFRFEGLPRAGR